jgi:hypothetical protein
MPEHSLKEFIEHVKEIRQHAGGITEVDAQLAVAFALGEVTRKLEEVAQRLEHRPEV